MCLLKTEDVCEIDGASAPHPALAMIDFGRSATIAANDNPKSLLNRLNGSDRRF
jgi:hypothetical protein